MPSLHASHPSLRWNFLLICIRNCILPMSCPGASCGTSSELRVELAAHQTMQRHLPSPQFGFYKVPQRWVFVMICVSSHSYREGTITIASGECRCVRAMRRSGGGGRHAVSSGRGNSSAWPWRWRTSPPPAAAMPGMRVGPPAEMMTSSASCRCCSILHAIGCSVPPLF